MITSNQCSTCKETNHKLTDILNQIGFPAQTDPLTKVEDTVKFLLQKHSDIEVARRKCSADVEKLMQN